ncbi:MAG: hypothetical protein JRE16_01750 [Deltaproteobacteria bacterium]|jgi:hypothetical protein|nr:hypothetical protein [Deltaproteobacteria bacterium]MBW2476557.1 hypothetical protein [Deltaproteobacteria bacterium]MBW2503273.1 hypothetical protein [Deltaproteobacteria bacterium]MBW2520847.1 hypothetical protein [Deltaproteobacteria bacterium]
MLKKTTILYTILTLLISTLALADDAMELKKKIYLDQKKLVVMENVEITDQEAEKFWPVFEKYQQEMFKNGRQVGKLISSYASVYQNMKDEEALELIDGYQEATKQRIETLNQYAKAMKSVLPGKKVFRCMQIEYKLEAMARYELAKEIPLAK